MREILNKIKGKKQVEILYHLTEVLWEQDKSNAYNFFNGKEKNVPKWKIMKTWGNIIMK